MKKIIETQIDDFGMNGEGIAHHDGKTIFVPFAIKDEKVKVEIDDSNKLIFGKLLEIETLSPDRTKPLCPYFQKCGGCDLQHICYTKSLQFKTNLVKNTLQKVGAIQTEVLPCKASDKQYNYRNKISLPVTIKNKKTIIGLFAKNSHEIIEIDNCKITDNFVEKLIDISKQYIERYKIKGYDRQTKYGNLKHIVARKIDKTILVTLCVKDKNISGVDFYVNLLANTFEDFGLCICENKNDKTILSNNIIHIAGKQNLQAEDDDILYEVGALSFSQVNNDVRNLLYSDVQNAVEKTDVIIDAYSGAGLLSVILSKNANKVYGVEIVKQAVQNANKLCQENNINNVQNIVGDCSEIVPKLLEKNKNASLVLDPPRSGCDKKVLFAIKQSCPQIIIYISCSPQTLARDLKILVENGQYKISFVQPYDMFPQTKHVETLVKLEKI